MARDFWWHKWYARQELNLCFWLRRPALYPELRAHGAGDGNRTHVTSLEGWELYH